MSEMQHRAMKPTSVARLVERWKAAISARKSAFPGAEWECDDPARLALTDAVQHILERDRPFLNRSGIPMGFEF